MAVNPNKLIPAKIKLKSSDDEIFEVDYAIAAELGVLGFMLEVCMELPIPLPFISSKVLSKLIEYTEYHLHAANTISEEEVNKWDQQFIKVDDDTLFDLLMVAYSLAVSKLYRFLTQAVADRIKEEGKRNHA